MPKSYLNNTTAENAQKTIAGREQAIKAGQMVGTCPLGYLVRYEPFGRKTVELDPNKAPLIAMAFGLVAEGNALRETVRQVRDLGLTGRHGEPISLPSLDRILRSEFYLGLQRYKGELYQANHPALISRDLFDRVQESLFQRRC